MSGVAVRAGYKLTEVGVIPQPWEVKSIRDLAQVKTGPFGTLLKAQEYSGRDGVPLISVGEIGHGAFKVNEQTPLVPDAVIRRLPQYLLRCGDIVFARKGSVERSALVTEFEDGWFLGSDGISIRPQRTCHPPYLSWQFQRHKVQAWLMQNATGTTMASLNQAILNRVHIPYAPLPEQRAIAAALSDMDALISGLDHLIAKKRDLRQAAMQQLLTGQRRLPGFKDAWQIQPLKSIIREFIVPMRDKPKGFRGNIPWCRIEDFDGKYLFGSKSNQCVDNDIIQKMNLKLFPVRTLLVSCSANLGRCAIVGSPLVSNQTFIGLVPDEKFSDSEFLFYLMTFNAGRLNLLSSGTTISYLSREQFESFEVIVPPSLGEQIEIAQLLSDMDSEIATLEARRNKTRDLKQGMMQELLTGRIRLV